MKSSCVLLMIIVQTFQLSAQTEIKSIEPSTTPLNEMNVYVTDMIVDAPEVEASFRGGTEAMKKWIEENLQYPETAKELGDTGRVYITFVVEMDGSISGVNVIDEGVTYDLNREAKRLARTMPRWMPAEVKGKKVRSRCQIMIPFALEVEE